MFRHLTDAEYFKRHALKKITKSQKLGVEASPVFDTLVKMRRGWVGVGFLSFFVNLLMLTGPLYMLQVYDRVISSRSMSTLFALTALMMLMYGFMGCMEFLRSRILVRIGNFINAELQDRTFRVWLKQGLLGKAAAKHRPLKDLHAIRNFLSGPAPITFFDLPWTPVYIGVIFLLNSWLGIFATIGALIVLVIAIVSEIATRKPQLEAYKHTNASEHLSQQCHASAEAVIALGMTETLRRRWSDIDQGGNTHDLKASDITGGATAFLKAFKMFMQSAILGLGALLAIQQIVSPGAMIAGSIILGRALAPIQMVTSQWRSFISTRNAYKRLTEFYLLISEDESRTGLPVPLGYVDVEQLTAAPPGMKKATLRGVQFMLKPGDGLCIAGPSGSGKSTLARLLVGVWSPQMGDVRLDGATFDQWDRNVLGQYIGYLPQQIELFDGTIGENIARFRTDVDSSEIIAAAAAAGVHDMILKLPDGYNTKIGEGGTILSVGQNQRIALARALFGSPCLVVMDEPNSNLDAQGDDALNDAIKRLRQNGKTVIVVTHRQSAMAALNKILILQNGKQVKFGLKDDLVKKPLTQKNVNSRKESQMQTVGSQGSQFVQRVEGPPNPYLQVMPSSMKAAS